jgi:hypothetical protein
VAARAGARTYSELFRDNDIDGEILCGMTAEDLKELGISSFGHRRKLLSAIATLGAAPPTLAQSAASATSAPASPPRIDAERRQLILIAPIDRSGKGSLQRRSREDSMRNPSNVFSTCAHSWGEILAPQAGASSLSAMGRSQISPR